MRILWLSGNPSMYASRNKYNGGGWVASLQQEIVKRYADSVELAIAFPWVCNMKDKSDDCIYYGIEDIHRIFWNYKHKESKCLRDIKYVVDEFKPDIIQVFGTEEKFGLVTTITDIPVIIHLQGVLSAYKETWLPEGVSWMRHFIHFPKQILTFLALNVFIKREQRIFSNTKFIFGRTEWDKGLASLLASQAQYLYCSEMLRPQIYNSTKVWKINNNKIKHIVSIISPTVYKGEDVILRTAKVLKTFTDIDFVWDVYGIRQIKYGTLYTHIKPQEVNVYIGGIIDAEQLVNVIVKSDVFVHPSYIENSPNTVCEAQLLGIPVIATNVGGVSSLIQHNENGVLVSANDVYTMASQIKSLLNNTERSEKLGINGRKTALERHNPEKLVTTLMNGYNQIIDK